MNKYIIWYKKEVEADNLRQVEKKSRSKKLIFCGVEQDISLGVVKGDIGFNKK